MKKSLYVSILALAAVFVLTACDPLPTPSSQTTTQAETSGDTDDANTSTAAADDAAVNLTGERIEAESFETLEDGRKIGGYGQGRIGDTCATYWFDFTVTNAKVVSEYEGYTASDGYVLLVADIKVKNNLAGTLDMYYDDFQIQWGDDENEDAYGYSITAFNDQMVPEQYTIAAADTVTYTHVYEIPADNSGEYSISFQEYFNDNELGNLFFIFFEADTIEVDTQPAE